MEYTYIQLMDEVIDYFLSSPAFLRVKHTEKALSSPTLEPKIAAYKKAHADYLEVKKYGSHHPDLAAAKKAFQRAKLIVFEDPNYTAYQTAYQTFQTELDRFSNELGQTISNQISVGHLNPNL